jgi:predicted TIM-barrel fold metal-dependent hydrolase
VCYWFERAGPARLLEAIGEDNVLFETDFPHALCLTEEQARVAVEQGLASVGPEARDKILFKNAAALYQLGDDVLDLVPSR